MAQLQRGHRKRVGTIHASVRVGMVSGYATCECENKNTFALVFQDLS